MRHKILVHSTKTPGSRLVELSSDDGDDSIHEPAPSAMVKNVLEHALLVDMPAIISPARKEDPSAAPPVANRVESRCKTTYSLCKIRIGIHGTLIVHNRVSDSSTVLDCICQVRQSNVEGTITCHGLFIHLYGKVKLTDIFQQAPEIRV